MKLVDIGETTSFLDHMCVGRFQHERKPDESIFDEYRESSNHELLLVQVKNCQGGRNFTHTRSNGLTTLKVIRKSALKETVKWQLKRQSSCIKSQLPAWMITFKEELESVGELSNVCSQLVLKCLYLSRIGRFDTLWSVHKLATAVTKWTRACDRH